MEQFDSNLNPLPIAISTLSELESDQFLEIIHKSGISIDLNLTEKEGFSHKTRIRTYIPRLNQQVRNMDNSGALHAIYLIFTNLIRSFPEKRVLVEERLREIGWAVVSEELVPTDQNVIELFFRKGLIHDAYTKIRELIEKTQKELVIIDPYVDHSLFELLKNMHSPTEIAVKILTKDNKGDFDHESELFTMQYSKIVIEKRVTSNFHDRFIIIDNSLIFHIGASIKDAGKKVFMINEIVDDKNKKAILESFYDAWKES